MDHGSQGERCSPPELLDRSRGEVVQRCVPWSRWIWCSTMSRASPSGTLRFPVGGRNSLGAVDAVQVAVKFKFQEAFVLGLQNWSLSRIRRFILGECELVASLSRQFGSSLWMSGGGHGARRYADALRRQNSSFGGLHHRRSSGLGRSVVHRRKRRLRSMAPAAATTSTTSKRKTKPSCNFTCKLLPCSSPGKAHLPLM